MMRRVLSPTLKTGGCEDHLSLSSHRYSPQKERPEDGGEIETWGGGFKVECV